MCDRTEMFDQWRQTPDYPTLYRVNREVLVDTMRAFPSVTGIRQDELPMWVKACALRVERPWMLGRQIAWMQQIRRRMVRGGADTGGERQQPVGGNDAVVARS